MGEVRTSIRIERVTDHAAVRRIYQRAFPTSEEADLVDALRSTPEFLPALSLVAFRGDEAIGHIMFTRIAIEPERADLSLIALAPMAVAPELQRSGNGSRLVRESLARAIALRHHGMVVLGHETYYPRFGFRPAAELGIKCPGPGHEGAFFAKELIPGALASFKGALRYAAPFAQPTYPPDHGSN